MTTTNTELRRLLERANLIYYLGGSSGGIFSEMESGTAYASKKKETQKHGKCPGCPHNLGLPKFLFVH